MIHETILRGINQESKSKANAVDDRDYSESSDEEQNEKTQWEEGEHGGLVSSNCYLVLRKNLGFFL